MIRSLPVSRARATLAVLGIAALALAGCSKKITRVDSAYTQPEGTPSADARLVIYPDVPVQIEVWGDVLPPGRGPEDTIQTVELRYLSGPGTIHGTIFDGTPASGYQVMRRESNGGFLAIEDFVLPPIRRWLQSQWEAYQFTDADPSGFSPATYLGRGVVAGVVTQSSPLTNRGLLTSGTVDTLRYLGNRAPLDSLITMKWQPVAGAVGYWMQIYQLIGSNAEKLLSASPAPISTVKTRENFVGYIAAPADSFKIGQTTAQIFTYVPLISGIEYFVRVSAVDSQGRMIAFTYGDEETLLGVDNYRTFLLGAVKVLPTPPENP